MKSRIEFIDRPDFTPSYTPVEMFTLGIFGGSYFKIPTNLPSEFIQDSLNLSINDPKENCNSNCYKILSGSSLEWWENKKLIHSDDPNGWVEWYVKFYYGRRHEDDDRQIERFRSFVSRHIGMLRSYESKGKDSVKTKQNLLQWAWDFKQNLSK